MFNVWFWINLTRVAGFLGGGRVGDKRGERKGKPYTFLVFILAAL